MMTLEPLQYLLGGASGSLVGFTLGLVGGGGSILAVPLMVYLVGVPNPHIAIGTSALAVAANAAANLIPHARGGNVKWRCAGMYAAAGVAGAWAGSSIGKAFDGEKLLFLFGRDAIGNPTVRLNRENAPKIAGFGAATGLFSGFFGIGGGFLIVPGLIASSGMPMINAVASSLVAVTAFGLTTSINYAVSGLIDWPLAAVFIGGGIVGGLLGARVAKALSARKGLLNTVFAILIFAVAAYVLWKSAGAFRA
jgi:uncharacterized membrane protein YfcA